METAVSFFLMLICLPLGVWMYIWPRRITWAGWYGTMNEAIYLYMYPPFFMALGSAGAYASFEAVGLPWPNWLGALLIFPFIFLLFLGVLAFIGLPMPPFLTPRWVREQRKRDRQVRRRRREKKRAERARKRAERAESDA